MPNSDESHGGSPDASWTRNLLAALIVVVLVLLTVLFHLIPSMERSMAEETLISAT